MPQNTDDNATVTPITAAPPTGTGLDQIVAIIEADTGLAGSIPPQQIAVGAAAASNLNQLIIEAAAATGAADDGWFTADEVRAMNGYIRANRLAEWTMLHGDDEDSGEDTGFHSVQNDGAIAEFRGENFVNTVADGLYHMGFEIVEDRFLNEDGDANACVEDVARWLTVLYTDRSDSASGLDRIVDLILADGGLAMSIEDPQIFAGADAANGLNLLIVEAVAATGALADDWIDAADVTAMNAYIRANHLAQWTALHGDDEEEIETGFHKVQNNGANTPFFGRNLVDNVADGIYHLGFEINEEGRFLNEDGRPNARVTTVASRLNYFLVDQSTTDTGLDRIVDVIKSDHGLASWTSAADINDGAAAADAMNHLIIEAIDATGVAADRWITADDVRLLNGHIRANHLDAWAALHGDDEEGEATGFHNVQNNGNCTELFRENLVDTVADGIYHLGFEIEDGHLLNEDGDPNASLTDVADWLNYLYNEVWLYYGSGDSEHIEASEADDGVIAQGGNDVVMAGGGDDFVRAGSGNDTAHGGSGDDRLDGERGNDAILGGDGDDVVIGGRGIDIFLGGAGADTFVYASGFGPFDGIFDFNRAEGDRIRIAADINGTGVASPEDVAVLCVSPDGVNGFVVLGSEAIIVVGVPQLLASDFVIGQA